MGMFCVICEQTRCVYTRTARTTFQENCAPDMQRKIINLMGQIGVTKSQKLRLGGVAQTKAKFENSNETTAGAGRRNFQSSITQDIFRNFVGKGQIPFEESYSKVLEWLYNISKCEFMELDGQGNNWYEMVALGSRLISKIVNHNGSAAFMDVCMVEPDILVQSEEEHLNQFVIQANLPNWKNPHMDVTANQLLEAKEVFEETTNKRVKLSKAHEAVFEIIHASGNVGVTYRAIRSINIDTDHDTILDKLDSLNRIHLVGFDQHRYVSSENIGPWVIEGQMIYRNEITNFTPSIKAIRDELEEAQIQRTLSGAKYFQVRSQKAQKELRETILNPGPNPSKKTCDSGLNEFLKSFVISEDSMDYTLDVKNAKFRIRPWHRIDGSIEFPLMAKYLHGIYVHIQQYPGTTFNKLCDAFGAPLDKCSLSDLLEYLERNGAIARHKLKLDVSEVSQPLWRSSGFQKEIEVIDDESFRYNAEHDCKHPIDIDENVWFEPLIHGINVVGHWDTSVIPKY